MEKTETLRRTLLSQFYRKNRFALSVAVFSALLSGTLNLMISWIMQQLIDLISGEAGALSLKTITLCCAGLGAVIVICYMINYCAIPRFMRRALVQYKNSAAYLSALTNDVSTLETDYLVKRISMIVMAVNFFGALAMMLWYSPLFTAVATGLMLLPLAVSLLTGSRMKTIERRVSDCNAKYTASLKDCLSGFAVVKSFHAEREIQSLYDADNRALENAKYTRRRIGNLINLLGTLAGYLAQIGVVLVGGYLAAGGRAITPGIVLAFTNLMNFLIQPVAELPTLLAGQKSAHALTEKLAETLQKGDDLADGGETATLCDRIELRDVSFGYEAEHEILHGVSTVFEHGKSYAIVGGSGSGKSTLLNLVMGSFSDYTGTISYDGTELHALRGESLVALTPLLVRVIYPEYVAVKPGERSGFQVVLRNTQDERLSGKFTVSLPDGWKSTLESYEFNLAPTDECRFLLCIAPPDMEKKRPRDNDLDLDFKVNGVSWKVTADLPVAIPWERTNLDTGKVERIDSRAIFQEVPAGHYLYRVAVKINPFMSTKLGVYSNRAFKAKLNGKEVLSGDGSFYVPAFHRGGKTGVNVTTDKKFGCWNFLEIEVMDGKEGELFAGFARPHNCNEWLIGVEYSLKPLEWV